MFQSYWYQYRYCESKLYFIFSNRAYSPSADSDTRWASFDNDGSFSTVTTRLHQVASFVQKPGCIFVWERDIFMIWQNYLWELLLPTLMVDRVVGCRCGHYCHQIEGSVWKQTASPPLVTLVTAECISRQVKRPQAIKWQRPFIKHWSAEVFFSGKRSKVWVFLKWPAREIKIQSCIRYCDVEDKVKISG